MSKLGKRLLLALVAVLLAIQLYSTKWDCILSNSKNREIILMHSCLIIVYNYNTLSHFCGCHSDWVQLSQLIKSKNYSFTGRDSKLYNSIYWGTKRMSCGDNSEYDDFKDDNVFLHIRQDSIFSKYNGELTHISFGRDVTYSKHTKLHDYGNKNKQVAISSANASITYLVNESEVDTELLRDFHHAINFDSVYVNKYQMTKYLLINKNNNKLLASIRYLDYGKRFFFDVYE